MEATIMGYIGFRVWDYVGIMENKLRFEYFQFEAQALNLERTVTLRV